MGLKYKVLKFILLLILLWFPLSGSDCVKDMTTGTTSVIGSWELVKMLGDAQDVCLGETAVFQESGSATLTCPNTAPRQRTYTFANNILTYTETSLSYSVEFKVTNGVQKMILTGRNSVNRVLTYDQTTK